VSVGKRIAEERKRNGLSQSAFADVVGVSFSSQRRYEDGRSDPDTAYLSAISKAGVDVGYVLTGNRGDDKDAEIKGYIHVINFLQGYLGLGKGVLRREFEEAAQASFEGAMLWLKSPDKNGEAAERADDTLRAVFQKSPALGMTPSELEDLLDRVEFTQSAKGLKLSSRDKARIIFTLYREEKESCKKSDFARVEEVIQRGGW
jgi:transcriptional regulator with XRE-family HTH domain